VTVVVTERCVFARFPDISTNEQVQAQVNDSDFEAEPELPALGSFISKDILRRLKEDEKKWLEVVNGEHCIVVIVVNITMTLRLLLYQ